jgi:hypothetical protein
MCRWLSGCLAGSTFLFMIFVRPLFVYEDFLRFCAPRGRHFLKTYVQKKNGTTLTETVQYKKKKKQRGEAEVELVL